MKQLEEIKGWIQSKQIEKSKAVFVLRNELNYITVEFALDRLDDIQKKTLKQVKYEYCVCVRGCFRTNNRKVFRGEALEIISKSNTPPFEIENNIFVKDELFEKYPFLNLRREEAALEFIKKHNIYADIVDYFENNGFADYSYPYLNMENRNSVIDQLRMLAASGFNKNYIISSDKKYIGIGMSFVRIDVLIELVEGLLKELSVKHHKRFRNSRSISFDRAVCDYGCGVPDLTKNYRIYDITEKIRTLDFGAFRDKKVYALKLEKYEANKHHMKEFGNMLKNEGIHNFFYIFKNDDRVYSSFDKFVSENLLNSFTEKIRLKNSECYLIACDDRNDVALVLGRLRKKIIDDNPVAGLPQPVWITDNPLFIKSDKVSYAESLYDEPVCICENIENIRSKSVCLSVNGDRIGYGSNVIKDNKMQIDSLSQTGLSGEIIWRDYSEIMLPLKFGFPDFAYMYLDITKLYNYFI